MTGERSGSLWKIGVAVAVLAAALAWWNKKQADRLAAEQAALMQAREELQRSREALARDHEALQLRHEDLQRSHESLQQQAREELQRGHEELQQSVAQAGEQERALKEAVEATKAYQEAERAKGVRMINFANGVSATSAVRAAMAEYYQSEGRWPTSNEDLELPASSGFAAPGVHGLTVESGGTIRVLVDDGGKRVPIYFQASVNPAQQILWKCVTDAVPDIAEVLPRCVYGRR